MKNISILVFILLTLNISSIHAQWINGQAADLVLGQPDFDSGNINAGGTTMNNTLFEASSVAVDFNNNKLYIADQSNNRVLRFAYPPISNQAAAEAVLGQPDFTSSASGLSSSGLHNPVDITVDQNGTLWVADATNSRVLRFDNAATKANGADADGVLGQSDFISNAVGLDANTLNSPFGVFIDTEGRLWVTDTDNARVLRFDNAAAKDSGAAADGVLGQPDFTSNDQGLSATQIGSTSDVYVDKNGALWVADATNNRILRFDNAAAKANGAAADGVLGQADFNSNNGGASDAEFTLPISVNGDEAGNIYVSDFNNRVLVFLDAADDPTVNVASYVIGQPDFVSSSIGTMQTSLFLNEGLSNLFVDSQNGSLWVTDVGNNRVLRYTASSPLIERIKYYVKTDGSDSNDGLSWENAFASLQKAIETVQEGEAIWVATGTYYPTKEKDGTTDNSRDFTFFINKDIQLLGGFQGDEANLAQREVYEANPTILSGDIGTAGNLSDNVYTVIHTEQLSTDFFMDGFFIQHGNSDGASGISQEGGGWYNDGSGAASNPTISNCSFIENFGSFGGAMFNYGASSGDASPQLLHCKFIGNNSGSMLSGIKGGAIYNEGTGGNSSPTLINCLFTGNALLGTNAQGGAIFSRTFFSGIANLNLINCTFYGNAAENTSASGGAIYNELAFGGTNNSTATNCIFWNNADEINNNNGDIDMTLGYCIFDDGTIDGTINLPDFTIDGGNNTDADPLFIDTDGIDNTIGTSDDNLKFGFHAPGHNTGNNMVVTKPIDLAGNTRILDGTVDIGAYEVGCQPIYVNVNATTGANNGTSWDDAYIRLQDALYAPKTCGEKLIWVAQGTYFPTHTSSGDDSNPHSRANTFELEESVKIYGGFQGDETDFSERDYEAYPTILSGNLGEPSTNTDNTNHVIRTTNNGNQTFVLDGFSIQDGYSNQGGNRNGGGLYSSFGDGLIHLSIANCKFKNNFAENGGAAIYLYTGGTKDPQISVFRGLDLINCSFFENDASLGSALYLQSAFRPNAVIAATATNCTFSNNISSIENPNSSVIFSGIIANAITNDLVLTNCIVWGNEDDIAYIENDASITVQYSLVEDGTIDGTLMLPANVTDGGNNLDDNPLFVDAPNGDFRLFSNSLAVDAGDNLAIPFDLTKDLGGNARIQNGVIDMGAYEGGIEPLPIEWLAFEATSKNDAVLLTWHTTIDRHHKGFEIEHRTEGQAWMSLGFMEASDNSSEIHSYNFAHESPKSGLNYYRLKQIDFNGYFTYSDIKMVFFEKEDIWVAIYPNPAMTVLEVKTAHFLENANLRLVDGLGRTALETQLSRISNLDVSNLPRGSYILKIKMEDREYVERVVIH